MNSRVYLLNKYPATKKFLLIDFHRYQDLNNKAPQHQIYQYMLKSHLFSL